MADNYLRGSASMLGATMLFSLSDVMAKYVTLSVPAIELATIRFAVFVLMTGTVLLRHPRRSVRSRPGLQVLRGVGVAGSAIAFILALGALPIAQATALNFMTPLFITVLAIPVLGEVVRPLGWAAVALGFVGMLVVVRPGLAGLDPAALLVVTSSLFWCVAILATRRLVGVDRSSTTLLWTACTGFAMTLCAVPFFLAPLTLRETALCVAVGVVAGGAQYLAVLAYRHARATMLAPLSYAQLIWSSLLGLLVFHAVPDGWTLAGAAIIAVSGLWIVQQERARLAGLAATAAAPDAAPAASR